MRERFKGLTVSPRHGVLALAALACVQLTLPAESLARPTWVARVLPGKGVRTGRVSRVQRAADGARNDLAQSAGVRRLFGLSGRQIRTSLAGVKVVSGASRYESRGWARAGRSGKARSRAKAPRHDTIVLSPLLGTRSAAGHESRHALHHVVASNLFSATSARHLGYTMGRVKRGVLQDEAFVAHVRTRGTNAQRRTMRTLERLVRGFERGGSPSHMRRLKSLANGRASALGALVYQHAYFVDPGMCEAAASHGDRGFTRLVTGLNGLAGRALLGRLPGGAYMSGYGNKKMQQQFGAASPWKKALLVPRAGYDRKVFFAQP